MSIAAQTASALVRAAIIGGVAVVISGGLAGRLGGLRGRAKSIAWALLLAPFLTPSLLISYAYSKLVIALVASPWSHQALYAAVLLLKLVPVAVIARTLLPSPLSAEARHAFRTLAAPSFSTRIRFDMRGSGPGPWFAGGLVFLIAFADFELASLWSIKSWTVAIFDAQTGGMHWRESLRLAALPLAIQVAVLAFLATRTRRSGVASSRIRTGGNTAFCYIGVAAIVVTALPLALLAVQAVAGFRVIAATFVLTHEIVASVLFAFASAVIAGGWAFRRTLAATALPGLLGSLVVALLVLAIFQTPLVRPAYDTPLPLLLALVIILLPMALLLGALLRMRQMSPMRHIARQLGSRKLAWALDWQPRLAAFGLLFCWAYFDFTAASILAPVGMTPVFVRLHNLAHYGQTAVLSAMMLAAFLVPVVLLLLTVAAGRIYARRDGR